MIKPKTCQDWVRYIATAELPSFGQTLNQIGSINEFMVSHAAELTRVVLRDPSMTAKVLRVANTVVFNPSQKKISTISRAVIVLGFQTIRSLCVATLLLDELLNRSSLEPLRREIAFAFDAAMQAREIALARREPNVEEIFIAALLFNIGDLSFWACGGESAEQVAAALDLGLAPEKAQEQTLGFPLKRLTAELAKEWKINDTLIQATSGDGKSTAAKCVQMANSVAHKLDHDMSSNEAQELLKHLAEFTGKTSEDWRDIRRDAQSRAGDMLKACGAGELINFFVGNGAPAIAADQASPLPEGSDATLQLAVLRELALMSQSKADINLVLQLVLEGLHRGAGLPRVGVALVNQQRTQLVAKYFVEWPPSGLQKQFVFDIGATPVLQTVLSNNQVLWAWRDADRYGFGVVQKATNATDCLLGPLVVNGKTIGVFYADHGQDALSNTDMEAFELFVLQARLCLQVLNK